MEEKKQLCVLIPANLWKDAEQFMKEHGYGPRSMSEFIKNCIRLQVYGENGN